MATRLHHFFVLTEPGAPVADRLTALGMLEGASNTHPGQGTANRRFFYSDAALELIYFTDEDEARNGPGRIIRSLDRYRSMEGSPFGLVFRAGDDEDAASYPGFPYQPLYFDEGQFFLVGDNADLLAEPTCVLMPRNLPNRPPQSLCGEPFESVSEVRLSVPVDAPSPVLALAAEDPRVTIEVDRTHLMEIVFGNEEHGEAVDLRPELPLIVRW